jgi:hypothetical protein
MRKIKAFERGKKGNKRSARRMKKKKAVTSPNKQ